MQIAPFPTCAKRMAVLLCCVVALDAAVAYFAGHPRIWCAMIPAIIPLMTPAVLFTFQRRAEG